jgi:adenine C2-methylase RlmN of 23S rRNA A2503 and tRNA A37
MLAGVNDRYEQALQLAALLEPRGAFKVNLIPYNPTSSAFEGSSRDAIAAFREVSRTRRAGHGQAYPGARHPGRVRPAGREPPRG